MNNFLVESSFVPVWARGGNEKKFFIYNGASMRPYFKPGDLLCVRDVDFERVGIGDIVILHWKDAVSGSEYVVHRVVSARRGSLITQGDNNLLPDIHAVVADDLVGLVVFFGRQRRVYSIRGGVIGLLYARFILARNYIWLCIKRAGWRFYNLIRKSRWIFSVWRPSINKIRVMTNDGPLVKYCYGSHTVARWWIDKRIFEVVKPFDLVIPNPEDMG